MYHPLEYYIFYKPYQVLCQFSAEGDKLTLAHFFKNVSKDIYPVGRLDYDSEGLLILTNDKSLNQQLLHPNFAHKKTYWVQVEGIPDNAAIEKLNNGTQININGKLYKTKPAKVMALQDVPIIPERDPPIRYRKNIPTSWLSISISEGKNRQVRKMTASVNLPTLRLIRYSIGKVTIEGMQPGTIINCDKSIVQQLIQVFKT